MTSAHRTVLDALKRRGRASVPQLADELSLNIETVRDHLKALVARDLVRRDGVERSGPGRPAIMYSLTEAAEALFPRREGEVLRELASWLLANRHEGLLDGFFAEYITRRREEALARVSHLTGRARIEEVARILAELGFQPVVEGLGSSTKLRLCHCPMRDLVQVTRIPCRLEVGLVSELLGEPVQRVSYLPEGDMSCSYERQGSGTHQAATGHLRRL